MNDRSVGRRRFLVQGGMAAAGIAALGAARTGEAPTTSPAQPPPMPPIPPKETYLARIQAARELMRAAKAVALLEPPGPDMRYLTGLAIERSDRLVAIVVPAEGPPKLLCPAYEREIVTGGPLASDEIHLWEQDEDPIGLLEKYLKKAGLGAGKLAMGGSVQYDEFAQIHAALPKLTFVSTTAIVAYLRERKSPEEVAILKAAAAVVERAIGSSMGEVREGMRERDLAVLIASRVAEAGAVAEGLVQFGSRTTVPRNPTSDRALAAGDMIQIDFGAQVHGYWADVSRSAILGKASGRMKLIHANIRQAQDLALESAKPGLLCSQMDQIARSTLGGRGFLRFLLHGFGHGLGLARIEPPYITMGYHERLAAGNVLTLEPGVYTPGEYGIRSGEMVEITTDGARLLTTPSPGILEI